MSEHGSALLDSALAIPVLLVFVCGIIQYGLILATYVGLRSTAMLTVRYVTMYSPSGTTPSDTQAFNFANSSLTPMLTSGTLLSATSNPCYMSSDPSNPSAPLYPGRSIVLQYDYPLFFSLVVPKAVNGSLVMSAKAAMINMNGL